jgi:DNA-binding CsgD family transcriptional regulator
MTEFDTSTSLMEQALDGLCVGLVTMDVAGRVLWMNRASQAALGIDLEEARDHPLSSLLRDPQIGEFWRQALETQATSFAEISLHWPRRAELKANATVAKDPSGEPIGRALLFCDVTHERTVQVQLSQETTERLLTLTENWNESSQAREGLTRQELRVLRGVGAGLSNRQLAEVMDVAVSTVRSHLKRLYAKLGLSTRSEAISYALRNGLT